MNDANTKITLKAGCINYSALTNGKLIGGSLLLEESVRRVFLG